MEIEFIVHTFDARALAALRRAAGDLRDRSHRVTGRVTFEPGDAERFARAATMRGVDLIVAAGGDGTVNEVVNGMLSVSRSSGPDGLPRLGVVPLGTANDFAGYLGVPPDVAGAVETAVVSPGFLADVGVLNARYFINVSTGGIGPEAVDQTSERAKRALGALAYFVAGVRKFAALRTSTARFVGEDGVIHDGDFLLYAVGNGQRAGGGNAITPRASLSDGLLDLCIVRPLTHSELLKLLPDLRAGRHVGTEHVVYTRVRELRVEPSGRLVVNADGEPADSTALEYRVLHAALRLAAPPPVAT